MNERRWDAIVVGSGLGGLTAAAYLSANGLRTLVLEQYDVVGGCSHVFRRKRAFEFDVGVHYLGDCLPGGVIPTVLRGLGLEGRIEFLPMDESFDTLVFPGLTFRVRTGWERYEQDLVAAFPEDERGLRKCVATLRTIARQAMAGGPPDGPLGLLTAPLRTPTLVRWSGRTLAQLFDACQLGERPRAVLAGESGTYGAPPSRASVLVHALLMDHYLRSGGFYPRGGGQVFAAHLLDVVRSHGSTVRTRARVERILVQDGRARGVRLVGGEELRAPVVISNADLKRTHLELVGPEHLRRKTVRRVSRMRMALPLFCVYLGLDIDLRERLANTNHLLFPSFDVEAAYRDCYEGRFPQRLPLYLTAASVKDPHTAALAPPGCSTLEIMTIAPAQHSSWHVEQGPAAGERYSRKPAYRAAKAQISERLIDGAAQVIGDIREHIVWQEAATPITLERYTLASGGTSYGLEHSPDQWALRRPRCKTEIGGLFLAGASTFYAHGVAGTMLGGVACAGAVLGRDLRAEVAAGAVFGDPSRLSAGGPGWDPLAACRRLSARPYPSAPRPARPPAAPAPAKNRSRSAIISR
jgi:all-trans-retinol 13,14-reductase